MPGHLPSDMPQGRPGDHLRTPGPRLRVVAPEPSTPVVRIPDPPEPWVSETRAAAARLHVVPAFEARVPERATFSPAAMSCPTERGIHRPHTARATWAAVALLAALLAVALIVGAA